LSCGRENVFVGLGENIKIIFKWLKNKDLNTYECIIYRLNMGEKVRKLRIGGGGGAYDKKGPLEGASRPNYETGGFWCWASRHPRGASALMLGAFVSSFYVVPRVASYVLGTLHYDMGDIPFLGQFLGGGETTVPVNHASQVCDVDTEDVLHKPATIDVEVPVQQPQQKPIDVAPPPQIDTAPDILDELGDEPSGWHLHIRPTDGSVCNGYSAKIDMFPSPPESEIVPGSISTSLSVREAAGMPKGLLENQGSMAMQEYASRTLTEQFRGMVLNGCKIG